MKNEQKLTKGTLWLMAIGAGLVVANNYYNQPLLGLMSKDFGVSESKISKIPMFTQIGYALGLFFLIPLGDMFQRKKIILIDFIFIIVALLAMALSPSVELLMPISLLIGFSSVIPQLFVPMAATLASPEQKAKAVGIVMSGLLVGILGSRVVSGYVGNLFGWRAMYYIAAGVMLILYALIYIKLPNIQPTFTGTYKSLVTSVFNLFKTNSKLQFAAFRGGFTFASFSAFWTPLVFHLENGLSMNPGEASSMAGMLGAVGAVGALTAAFMGKIIAKYDKNKLLVIFIFLMVLSWVAFYFASNILFLVLGIILIDIGVQATHITNQTIIFSIDPNAINRINTVYMTNYFIAGSLGTYFSGIAYQHYQWNGVVLVGGVLAFIPFAVQFLYSSRSKQNL